MSLKRLFAALPTTWPLAVIFALAFRAAFGSAPILASEYVAWLFLGVAPVLIARVIMRGMSSSPSMSQVLYDVEHADTAVAHDVRERLRGFSDDDRTRP